MKGQEREFRRPNRGRIALALLGASVLALAAGLLIVESRPQGVARAGQDPLSAAKIAFMDRDLAGAEKLLRGASDTPEVKALLGRVLLERGRLDEARQIFAALIKADPKDAEAARGMGRVLLRLGQPDLAVGYLQRGAQLSKEDAAAWKELGHAQRESGDALGAMSSFQQSLKLDPGQADLSALLPTLAMGRHPAAGFAHSVPPIPQPFHPAAGMPQPASSSSVWDLSRPRRVGP